MLKALIWDVDGTLAESERDGHRVAFNQAFEAMRLPWRWSVAEYGPLLRVTGGRERLLHDMRTRPGAPADPAERVALAAELHGRKNRYYGALVAQGALTLRPGVRRLIEQCEAEGVALAVATTTSTVNARALFDSLFGPRWRERFAAVACAEDAPLKKPDPQVYTLCLQRLGLRADEAFAIEDSPNGLRAARGAGLACGITRSAYFKDVDAAEFAGAAWVQSDLETPAPMTLQRLRHALSASITASATARPPPP